MIKSYFNVCLYILNIYFRAIITEPYSLLFYEVTAIKTLQHIIKNWAISIEKSHRHKKLVGKAGFPYKYHAASSWWAGSVSALNRLPMSPVLY